MSAKSKRLAHESERQELDGEFQGDYDLSFVVTEAGKNESCIKSSGNDAAVDGGCTAAALKARVEFRESDDCASGLFERALETEPTDFFSGVELGQLLSATNRALAKSDGRTLHRTARW